MYIGGSMETSSTDSTTCLRIRKPENLLQPLLVFCALSVGFCVVIRVLFGVPLLTLGKYALVELLAVFLPGYAAMLLLRFDGTTFSCIALSYAIGYAITIVEYFIVYIPHLQKYAAVLAVLIALLSTAVIIKRRNTVIVTNDSNDGFVIIVIFAAYLVVNILSYSANYLSPFTGWGGTEFRRDIQFWCSNAVALKLSFPPQPVYFAGGTLFYHYFSSMQIAFLSQISGIDVFSLACTLFPFGKCILFVGGINYLLNLYNLKSGKAFFMLLLLFMTGKESISNVSYTTHTISGPFGFDIGLAFSIWFLSFLILQWRMNKFDVRLFVTTTLFWLVTVGAKAPIAAVLILAPALICLKWVIDKQYKLAFSYGVVIAAIFLAVSIGCAGMLRFAKGTPDGARGVMLTLYTIEDVLTTTKYAPSINLILSIMYTVFWTHPILAVTTALNSSACFVFLLMKKTGWKQMLLPAIMLIVTIFGLALGLFINAGGNSESYFTMAAFVPCVVYNAEILYLNMKAWGGRHAFAAKYAANFAILLFSLIGIYFFCFYGRNNDISASIISGQQNIQGNGSYSADAGCSRDEALACVWLRDNSPIDSIMLCDRNTVGEQTLFYYVGIFSERQQYIEATDLIFYVDPSPAYSGSIVEEASRRKDIAKRMFNNEEEALLQLKASGVDYIMQDQRYSPKFHFDDSLVALVFRSGGVSIYQVL